MRDIVGFSATKAFNVGYRVVNTDPLLDVAESTHDDWVEMFDLTRLTPDTRIVMAALMLLPFGVLLTVIFSEIIGVRCYGVLSPALLSLSLAYVPWQSATMVLIVVLLVGVGGRSQIRDEPSRVLRLAVMLTLVVLGIAASASLMEFFDIGFGGQLVLLPIVILSSLVGRFYSVLDDRGLHTALIRLGWILLLALLCIPIVQFEALGHWLIRIPEMHLLNLAAILFVHRVKGRQLIEFPAFAWLNGPDRRNS